MLALYEGLGALYDEHKDELWDILGATAEQAGYNNALDMLANGKRDIKTDAALKIAVVLEVANTMEV